MTTTSIQAHQEMTTPWRDTALPVDERVELLLTEMTLEEKVAQLGSRWVGNDNRCLVTPVDICAVAVSA